MRDLVSLKPFDTTRFPFREIFTEFLQEIVGCPTPEQIHEYIPQEHYPDRLLKIGEDQKTFAHEILYKIDPAFRPTTLKLNYDVRDRGFISTYREFVGFLEGVFGESLVFQTLPTIRVQLPRNLSVGEFHRDRQYNHPVEEVNIWVPITESRGTASLHLEREPLAGNHQPVEVAYGDFLIFDSGLEHGNKVNEEGYSRISFDFRVIPKSLYKESAGASYNQGKKFSIGGYYSEF